MRTLIIGASGATGKLLVEQMLSAGQDVKVIVRHTATIPQAWHSHDNLQILRASISEMTVNAMAEIISDCDAIASCLGHNLTLQGVFGKPRKLVTNAVQLTCEAISKNNSDKEMKFILMNSVGNQNRDINEPISVAQKIVIALVRLFVPPQADNEKSSDYLRLQIGQSNPRLKWVTVRPDSLVDEPQVTDYSLHPSPLRSAIFNPGKTSRINVANFMAQLMLKDDLWKEWEGKMPVIYNSNSAG